MFDKLSILQSDDDTKYTFAEWGECPNILEVTYLERVSSDEEHTERFTLPVFNREDWEEFKAAGDMAFKMMEIKHV